MPASFESISKDALELPTSGRALLVEKLLASLAGEVNPDVEGRNLQEVGKRRQAVKAGEAKLVDGLEGMRQIRAALK